MAGRRQDRLTVLALRPSHRRAHYGPRGLAEEFAAALDFRIEARHGRELARSVAGHELVCLPEIVEEDTPERVLVMELRHLRACGGAAERVALHLQQPALLLESMVSIGAARYRIVDAVAELGRGRSVRVAGAGDTEAGCSSAPMLLARALLAALLPAPSTGPG